MKRLTVKSSLAFVPGLGLTLALLWLLGSPSTRLPVVHAAELQVCLNGCAYPSVQAAVDAASTGDIIKVATGKYTGVSTRAGVTQVVYLSKTITIQGGYTTTNWTTAYPLTQPTTLDAQGQGRVLYITGNISPTIEGLRITGGNAAGLGGAFFGHVGGGVYIITATAIIDNNWVFSNTAQLGGGLSLYNSAAVLNGNTLAANTATSCGGGALLFFSPASVSNNTVISNTAPEGGGLCLSPSDATLSGNTIVGNTSTGATPGGGGGIRIDESRVTLTGNTIIANVANVGGGVFLSEIDSGCDATISGNVVLSNTASNTPFGRGGGLYLECTDAIVSGNTVAFNTASYRGGGLELTGGTATLMGNSVIANMAGYGGGLVLSYNYAVTLTNNIVADNRASDSGSGMWISASATRLLHTTIARNSGGDGSGIHYSTGEIPFGFFTNTAIFTNTILVSHTVGITVAAGSTATLQATLWGTGTWANTIDWGGDGTILTGTVNVRGDPKFANPAIADYHIISGSAAINAGINAGVATDIDSQPRPYQTPDLGADEYWPPGTPKSVYLPVVLRQFP